VSVRGLRLGLQSCSCSCSLSFSLSILDGCRPKADGAERRSWPGFAAIPFTLLERRPDENENEPRARFSSVGDALTKAIPGSPGSGGASPYLNELRPMASRLTLTLTLTLALTLFLLPLAERSLINTRCFTGLAYSRDLPSSTSGAFSGSFSTRWKKPEITFVAEGCHSVGRCCLRRPIGRASGRSRSF
jgi:hypothetical protein